MKKFTISFFVLVFCFSSIIVSCKKEIVKSADEIESEHSFDSALVASFFQKHPKLKEFRPQVEKLYKKHTYHYLWYDRRGLNELGELLYSKINNLDDEGVPTPVPYRMELDRVVDDAEDARKPLPDTELLISSLYFFYADKVFHGIDAEQSRELGWYLPRKKLSYVNYLDSLLMRPSLINKDVSEVLGQYYRLRDVLEKYRTIQSKGGWKPIQFESEKSLKPGDSATAIAQVRTRLAITGDLGSDSHSAVYDSNLEKGILNYKKRMAMTPDKTITPKLVKALNVPVADRIQTIMANMERCRWISTDIAKAEEYIVINIPSYKLTYFKEGKPAMYSNVVVGKDVHKTVVFSGLMKYIVFSPYWNIPKSIVAKEIEPSIAENPNYLEEHDMEYDGDQIRQRPGPKNSLGLVKFLFPNSNNIYLHDTPAKELFNKDTRAASHGCIRVEKPTELANLILKDDKDWNAQKIEEAMRGGEEKWVTLKNKIPVYIGYFTAWVDGDGVHFYEDIYDRDGRLQAMIYDK